MGPDQALPLVIMTSADTHLKTEDLLARNGHFGAKSSQIILVKQEQVPALADSEAHFVLQEEGSQVQPAGCAVLTKPHGHGDVHRLLYASGTVRQLQEQGYKWLYFFQDTNALSFKPMVATLGLSVMHNLDMNTMAVPRKPGDACGALMRLRDAVGNRYAHVSGVAYRYGKRGRSIWQKRPIYMAKEAYANVKRGLSIWLKRPMTISTPQVCACIARPL